MLIQSVLTDTAAKNQLTASAVKDLEKRERELKIELGLAKSVITETAIETKIYGDKTAQAAREQEIFILATGGVSEALKEAVKNTKVMASTTVDSGNIISVSVGETTKEVSSAWTDVSQRIKDRWTTALSDMLQGAKTFEEGLAAMWEAVKIQFFDMVAKMITEWTMGFISKLLTSSKTAEAAIGGITAATGETTAAMEGASVAGTGLGATIGAVAAIAAFATIIFAGFLSMNNNINENWEAERAILDRKIEKWRELGWSFRDVTEAVNDYTEAIRNANDATTGVTPGKGGTDRPTKDKNWTGAATGFHDMVTGPRMFYIEPGRTELVNITPQNELVPAGSPQNGQGVGAGSPVNITIYNEQNISGQAAMSPDQLADLFAQNVNEMTPKIKAALDRY